VAARGPRPAWECRAQQVVEARASRSHDGGDGEGAGDVEHHHQLRVARQRDEVGAECDERGRSHRQPQQQQESRPGQEQPERAAGVDGGHEAHACQSGADDHQANRQAHDPRQILGVRLRALDESQPGFLHRSNAGPREQAGQDDHKPERQDQEGPRLCQRIEHEADRIGRRFRVGHVLHMGLQARGHQYLR